MIHQRGEAHALVGLVEAEALEAIRRRDLAAEVDEVLGAQPARSHGRVDRRIAQLAESPRLHAAVVVEPDAERIEHGGDAGGRDLRVMRLHGGDRVPAHAGTRRVVALEVIGMEFDEARQQVVAVEILARRAWARRPRR